MFKDLYFILPARKGSKRFPFKNRKLFKFTADLVKDYADRVIVTTDDEEIMAMAKDYKFTIHKRKKGLASDKATTKDFMLDIEKKIKTSNMCLLYLTYPYRKMEDIVKLYYYFIKKKYSSLLTTQPVLTHPCLTIVKKDDKWVQSIKHDLCSSQDYPEAQEITHYLFFCKTGKIHNLNNNLYNIKTTHFFPLEKRVTDIDYENEFKNN
jgi:CMP-N,N'-diacetyllegionaminic acid synthase